MVKGLINRRLPCAFEKIIKNFYLPIDIVGKWCYNTVVVKIMTEIIQEGEPKMSAVYFANQDTMMWCRMLNSRVCRMAGASDTVSVL